jgi:ribonuclease E
MANKMLIDATHPEETRVVVLRGNRVEEFDFESASRRQLRGNIYLAKVTRVEPSLQAAFVDYGGNRHGFLAFSEIHPDYYQIPVADRQALIAEEERAHRDAEAEVDRRAGGRRRPRHRGAERPPERIASEPLEGEHGEVQSTGRTLEHANDSASDVGADTAHTGSAEHESSSAHDGDAEHEATPEDTASEGSETAPQESEQTNVSDAPGLVAEHDDQHSADAHPDGEAARGAGGSGNGGEHEEEEIVESVGGADALEEVAERMPRFRRQYKIQEVIKRRQIMLVQVVKEERGTKGAALTTYLSLAGRYSVLMPNTARGGGISRKITKSEDRTRLKEVAQELEVPEGMGVILRTAGASRTKTEIKRDFEYLLRLWETVRDLTLKSTAPTLVYEEGSLVRRSIRDLYNKDIDEVIVAGGEAFRDAKDFMRMLMPTHAKNVKPYHDAQPLFTRFGIESQLDAMFSPVVQLRSGGYIVLNQAEALVAIDVNSGRATREHHIEDTALKTNIEASEEISRQLRLRDLAGLIVIDFIDMDEKRNNRAVERRLKECLKNDRARIQVGRISHFGLLEMSRQRIRTSVLESSTDKCPHCGGTGHVRSVSSVALQLLRGVEETLLRGATHNLIVRTREEVALYVLNHKRSHLHELEARFRISLTVSADPSIGGQQPFSIDRGEQIHSIEQAKAIASQPTTIVAAVAYEDEDDALEETGEAQDIQDIHEVEEVGEDTDQPSEGMATETERAEGGDNNIRRRRRRRRRGRHGEVRDDDRLMQEAVAAEPSAADEDDADDGTEGEEGEDRAPAQPHASGPGQNGEANEARRRRRRGRRGGRRGRRGREGEAPFPGLENGHSSIENGHQSIEPELAEAVADFGGPPPSTVHIAPVPEEAPAPPAAAQPEQPRRRSTVREPAPIGNATPEPMPTITPVATEQRHQSPSPDASKVEDASQPRKTGWWSRRSVGGDNG